MKRTKPNLLTIAAAIVLSGVGGGVLGSAASGVVNYDQLRQHLTRAQQACDAHPETPADVRAAVDASVNSFLDLDANAKGVEQGLKRR